jgi:hypothetical protein
VKAKEITTDGFYWVWLWGRAIVAERTTSNFGVVYWNAPGDEEEFKNEQIEVISGPIEPPVRP